MELLIDKLNLFCTFPSTTGSRQELPLDLSPELQILSLVIVATKLYNPFDDTPRHPSEPEDPASLAINWRVWNKSQDEMPRTAIQSNNHTSESKGRDHWEVKPRDIFTMNGAELDDYLDWFERMWLAPSGTDDAPENARSDFDRELFRLFPLTNSTRSEAKAQEQALPPDVLAEREAMAMKGRTKAVTAGMIVREPISRNKW